jgi:hypothetical protein
VVHYTAAGRLKSSLSGCLDVPEEADGAHSGRLIEMSEALRTDVLIQLFRAI